MCITTVLKELRARLLLSRPKLSQALGFRSPGYIWVLENKQRKPSFKTCMKIIKMYESYLGKKLTIEMLRED